MPPRTQNTRAEQKRARAEAARLAALRRQRRRRLQWIGVIAIAIVAVAAIVLGVTLGNRSTGPTATATSPSQQESGWGLPADPSAAAARAGLPMLGQEMLDVH